MLKEYFPILLPVFKRKNLIKHLSLVGLYILGTIMSFLKYEVDGWFFITLTAVKCIHEFLQHVRGASLSTAGNNLLLPVLWKLQVKFLS